MVMRKVVLAVAILALGAGLAFAQGASFQKDGMILSPGTLDANAGVGYDYGAYYGGISVGGGAELVLGKFDIAKGIPLTFGAAARAAFLVGYTGTLPLSAGAFGTLHFCWGALDLAGALPWLDNIDTYIGIGIKILPHIGLESLGGTSYFFSPSMAVNVESGIYSSTIGLLLKL
jgi:hypothetical protein